MQGWINPMQPPKQSWLPSLEDLTCGNAAGVRPQTITKAQLDAARPLQQVPRCLSAASRVLTSIAKHAPPPLHNLGAQPPTDDVLGTLAGSLYHKHSCAGNGHPVMGKSRMSGHQQLADPMEPSALIKYMAREAQRHFPIAPQASFWSHILQQN